jgi:hypothetical protein
MDQLGVVAVILFGIAAFNAFRGISWLLQANR